MRKTLMQIILDSIPESYNIREKALEMDEKEFDLWWWETIYKNKNHLELEKQQLSNFFKAGFYSDCMGHEDINDYFEQYYNLKFKDNEK